MKTYFAIGLTLLLVGIGVFRHQAYRVAENRVPALEPSSSSSQIYIHGTPVCVFEMNGNILAKVGPCAEAAGPEGNDPPQSGPFSDNPSMKLPPGHPPVNPDDMSLDEPRRIQI